MTTTQITKTIIYNGIEIRRSNEMTSSNAYLHRNPLSWVVDGIGCKRSFRTQKEAQKFIDTTIAFESTNSYGDWSGNYWIVRIVNNRFTEVAISREEHKAIKNGAK
jgi:hypothetical protein